jgi:hypothetical protein
MLHVCFWKCYKFVCILLRTKEQGVAATLGAVLQMMLQYCKCFCCKHCPHMVDTCAGFFREYSATVGDLLWQAGIYCLLIYLATLVFAKCCNALCTYFVQHLAKNFFWSISFRHDFHFSYGHLQVLLIR